MQSAKALARYTTQELATMYDALEAQGERVQSGPRKGSLQLRHVRVLVAYGEEIRRRESVERDARLAAAMGDRDALDALWIKTGDYRAKEARDALDAA